MRNTTAIQHLKKASTDLSYMLIMINNNVNCIDVIKKSKNAQLEIKAARAIILESYMEKSITGLIKYKKQEKLEEIMKLFRYR